MLHFYLKTSLFLVLTFAALIALMGWIGALQPIHPALRGFVEGSEDIPQPCWYGIVPGVTRIAEANAIIERVGYLFVDECQECSPLPIKTYSAPDSTCDVYLRGYENLSSISLSCDEINLSIGDIMSAIGTPDSMEYHDSGVGIYYNFGMRYSVAGWISPFAQENHIELYASSGLNSTLQSSEYIWRGFVFCWRWRQHSPRTHSCDYVER